MKELILKILKYSLILFTISIVLVIGVLIFTPYYDYQACMDSQESWAVWDGEYVSRDIKSICKEKGFYLQEIDGILYDSKTNIPFTGKIKYYDSNNFPVHLIYGCRFYQREMEYKNGKLDGLSSYVDGCLNPVGFELYKDGVLIDQWNGADEAAERGISWMERECGPPDDTGWRSCSIMEE